MEMGNAAGLTIRWHRYLNGCIRACKNAAYCRLCARDVFYGRKSLNKIFMSAECKKNNVYSHFGSFSAHHGCRCVRVCVCNSILI